MTCDRPLQGPSARRAAWSGRAAIAAALCWPLLAAAHADAPQTTGLLAGLLHPVSGLDHLLAMVAVGLWGAQLGAPALWLLPLTFPLVMAFGGMLALIGVPLPGAEVGIALSALVLGIALLKAWRPPFWLAAVVVGAFAVFHGHAHGSELPPGASGLAYSLGFVVATGLLHGLGIALGMVQHWPRGRWLLRAAGGAVAAAGMGFLWRAVA